MYGLFVEHYQQYQTIWNGNGGRTYFYQNEMPYDPPNQAAWMNGSTRGLRGVQGGRLGDQPRGVGPGQLLLLQRQPVVVVASAPSRCPSTPGVRFHNMVTVSLGGAGTINRVINNTGGPANSTTQTVYLTNYP